MGILCFSISFSSKFKNSRSLLCYFYSVFAGFVYYVFGKGIFKDYCFGINSLLFLTLAVLAIGSYYFLAVLLGLPASDVLVPRLLNLGFLPAGTLSNPITRSFLSLSSSPSPSSNSGISLFFFYKFVSELVIIGFEELKV